MRVVIQRVSEASVEVGGKTIGAIRRGYMLLVGIGHEDDESTLEPMARKIVNMRLFPDPDGDSGFHRSLLEENAEVLAVSQFTLHADCRKGRRPSFIGAAPPVEAERLFDLFVEKLRALGPKVETGQFGAKMNVSLVNAGPVTIWLDSEEVLNKKSGGVSL